MILDEMDYDKITNNIKNKSGKINTRFVNSLNNNDIRKAEQLSHRLTRLDDVRNDIIEHKN